MKEFIYKDLDLILGNVNWYNSAVNEELKKLECEEEGKYFPMIDKDIEGVKALIERLTDEEAKLIRRLIQHCQMSGEIESLGQDEFDEKVKGMAEMINDMPVAEFDLN